jgi:serine O-acetyltransferase
MKHFSADRLADYVSRQMNHFFPFEQGDEAVIESSMEQTLRRVEHCFQRISHPSYSLEGRAMFNIFNSDQYAAFLCILGGEIHRQHPHHPTAQKSFALNKALHGLNCMYDVELPQVFWLLHTVGTVIGKAIYGNYLVLRQGCTIGALRGEYPVTGEGFIMSAGCSVIGRSCIGDNVMLGPNTTLLENDIPANSLVSGHYAYGLKSKPLGLRAIAAHFHLE